MGMEDGVPLIDHLKSVERQTGQTPQMLLDAPPCPQGCEDVWRIFGELHSSRQWSEAGPRRITYVEMDAFQRVTGIVIRAWERDAIRKADTTFLTDWLDRQPKPNP